MKVDIIKRENHVLVRVLEDKLDASNAPDLKSEFVMLNAQGVKNIIVDMSACAYCDSSGLRSILVANRLCDEAIGTLIISGLQPDVENIFRISMLHTVLLITKSTEEAQELLRKKENL
jgi:anti-sigma B factor antagonist